MTTARILRRYIARRSIVAISGVFLMLVILIFMADFMELLRRSGKYGSVPGRTLVWLTMLRVPSYTEVFLPVAVMVGVVVTYLMLARKSELAVIRAAGLSVWQILRPTLAQAFVIGIFAVLVYNPMAAGARAQAERLYAKVFGQSSNFLRSDFNGSWLRQDGSDGPSILTADSATDGGLTLTGVTAITFDHQDHFLERIEAQEARLMDGYWQLEKGFVVRMGQPSEAFGTFELSTYLTPDRVRQALATETGLSVFELPGLIEVAERAGLSAQTYRVKYETLKARPFLLLAMVLLAATVSLRSFRSGGVQRMVIGGLASGVGFFLLAEVSRQIGAAGLVPAEVAVWVPVVFALLATSTIILHQEDG